MRNNIPNPDSETNKTPMIMILVIIALFIVGYFVYVMLIPQQVEQLNNTEQTKTMTTDSAVIKK